ncbi:hypothetical protein ACFV2N_20690 [Streptomyces sp. NPDC059680]|uniref:hypothetical protein n=1 Tax=Streptomyces sp. NPDC059680 TaxID=3346904 RepID=UPI00368F5311
MRRIEPSARVVLHDLAMRRDTLLVRAVRGLGPRNGLAGNADSAAVLVTLGGVNVLWPVT